MKIVAKYLLLTACFIAIVTAVSVSLPPGFLLPKPAQPDTATVLSLTPVHSRGVCLMTFEFEGEKLELMEPLSACSEYSIGQKVTV